jgi:hypothetical protein
MSRVDSDRIAKLQSDKPAQWESQVAAITERVSKLSTEREPHAAEAKKLLGEAHAAAGAAAEEEPHHTAVVRAQALYFAIAEPEKGKPFFDELGKIAAHDPLSLYVRAAAALAGKPTREKQDAALSALAEVQQVEPGFLRAIYDSAAIAADRQQFGPAREALTKLLARNPQHERAQQLLTQLPAAQ